MYMANCKKNIKANLQQLQKIYTEHGVVLTPARFTLAAALFQYGNNLSAVDVYALTYGYVPGKVTVDVQAYYNAHKPLGAINE